MNFCEHEPLKCKNYFCAQMYTNFYREKDFLVQSTVAKSQEDATRYLPWTKI